MSRQKEAGEKWTFFVGSHDPEMDAMITILKEHDISVVQACVDGKPVYTGNAYEANNTVLQEECVHIGFIECWIEGVMPDHIIDHHRPGDPGYGKGSGEYWEASSIGQLYSFLRLPEPTQHIRVLAAADHCLYEAMQGHCPGVTVAEMLQRKYHEIAESFDVSRAHVQELVARYEADLSTFRQVQIADTSVYVVPHTGKGSTCAYLSAQVAAAKKNVAVLIIRDGGPPRQERMHLCGAVSEELAQYFIDHWAEMQGFFKIYGNPSRGYAGAYRAV